MKRTLVIVVSLVASLVLLLGSSPAEAGPVKGGVLGVTTTGDPASFDGYTSTSGRLKINDAIVFSGLIRTDPVKEEVTIGNLIPSLAERWEISPDGKTYTFYLRKGVQWHDGKPFTAKDVVYSLNKYRDPAKSVFAYAVSTINRVEQVDDYTVKIHLTTRVNDFLFYLMAPFCSIHPEHLKGVNPKSTDFLVGTGPFMFKEYIPGKKISYVKNPNYFEEGLPYLDGVTVYYMKQREMPNAFIGGELDVLGNLRSYFDSSVDDIKKVKALVPEAGMKHAPAGSIVAAFFSFAKEGPWNDVRVRRAMTLVLNPEDAVLAMVGGFERGDAPGFAFVPRAVDGALSIEKVNEIIGTNKTMEARIAEAKRLMAEAGYASGFKAPVSLEADEWKINFGLYCEDTWQRHLNIDAEIRQMDEAQWGGAKTTGQFEMAVDSIGTGFKVNIYEYLNQFLGKTSNPTQWKNEEYIDTVKQLQRETDPTKEKELMAKAQTIAYKDLPYIPVCETAYGCAWRPDLMTGWPAKKGIVMQKHYTTMISVDRMWLAGTDDAKRWMK